jgi:hypothetical protein
MLPEDFQFNPFARESIEGITKRLRPLIEV